MFIVVESIDGGGCQTQAELLAKNLPGSTYLKFPHYDTPVGKMIRDFLYENKKLNVKEQFLLYSLQFVFDSPMIKEKSQNGIVIADRFFTTTLCYQTLGGISEEIALRFAQDFEIIKPDVVYFLDVDPEIAIKRKHGENKEKNFMEKDFDLTQRTYVKYQDLIKRNVWANWKKIDGNGSIEEIQQIILKDIKK